MFSKRIVALGFVVLMITSMFSGLSLVSVAEDVGKNFIENVSSAPAGIRLNDAAWHPSKNIAVAVGNDTGNGYIYRYEPDYDNWVALKSRLGDNYKGVARIEPWSILDNVETDPGWTINSWKGNLSWMRTDPAGLPVPGSGVSHGNAYSPTNVWWFGNTTNGDYNDNNKIVAGSIISPVKHIPDISTRASLSFQHWFNIEGAAGAYDFMRVLIKNTTDSGWTELKYWNALWVSQNGGVNGHPEMNWNREIFDISGWIGNDIQINFTFDSGSDGSANAYAGWHLDNIRLESNGVFMAVGSHGTGSYSAFATDGYSAPVAVNNISGLDLLDVAAGPNGDAVVVGLSGNAAYWDGKFWNALNGPSGTDTLTAVDSNDTHLFIVGFDSTNQGIAYYSTFANFRQGNYTLYRIPGTVNWKLQDIAWSDIAKAGSGPGLGIIAADGNLIGLTDPEIWTNVTPPSSPAGRYGHAMVYVSGNNKIVSFGGWDTSILTNETWVYDTSSNTWTNNNPASSPSARRYHAMAYDSANNKVVMFGGSESVSTLVNDTWIYDPSSNTWTLINTTVAPSKRQYHAMAYDSASNKVVLFGGWDGDYDNETWIFDTATGKWTNVTPAASPSPRSNSRMVYDSKNDMMIIFGGNEAGTGWTTDTWTYKTSSNTWTEMFPVNSPSPRYGHSMAYDSAKDRTVLYGGHYGNRLGDTWTYNISSNDWFLRTSATNPPPLYHHTMVYDSNTDKFVMFGGIDDGGIYRNDTWHLDTSSPWGEPASNTNGENFTAIAWDDSETFAIAVGNSASKAVLYSYYAGNKDVSPLPDYKGVLSGHELYGISFRPTSHGAEYALVTGASAIKVWTNSLDDNTTITVNVDKPHIFDHGLWKTSDGMYSTSKLEAQLDIDTTYTFYAEVNYTVGGVDDLLDADGNVRIEVMGWYDEGNTANSNPEPTWLTTYNRTRQFRLMWVEGSGSNLSNASMSYPASSPGTDEFLLDSWWMDPTGYGVDENTRRFFFNVTLGPQTWAADGNGFGNRIGTPYYDKLAALNDPNSWDFRIRVFDNDFVDSFNLSFGEFGVFRYTNITATGNPGGNAPPGAVNAVLGPQTQIIYSANVPYYVNISIGDLLRQGGGGSIPASKINVSLQNDSGMNLDLYSEINGDDWVNGRSFPGAGITNGLCVWGNRTQAAQDIPAPRNGTTSHGPWGSDFNSLGVSNINWWANVPGGTLEGIYQATVTFTIEFG